MLIQKVPAAKEILHLGRKPFVRMNCTQHFPCLEQYVDTRGILGAKKKGKRVEEEEEEEEERRERTNVTEATIV